jgi:RimJ/RimL family protein N-acetyltransferase
MPAFPDLPLRSRRLVLRPPKVEDADALFSIFSHAEAMRFWATPPWQSRQQALDRIEQDLGGFADGSALRLLLEPAAGGPILGAVALFGFVEGSGRAETGYIVARPMWGNGFAQEAMRALLTYAFTSLRLRRVEADIDPRNAPSARLLDRLGFVREGYLRERWVVDGEVSDTALYGILASAWKPTTPSSDRGPAPTIEVRTGDAPAVEAFLAKRIYEFNAAVTGHHDGESFTAVHPSGSDDPEAGASGYTWGGCCWISYLWVAEPRRGQGLGSELLDAIERYARGKRCTLVLLASHSFQAPGFYARKGYEEVARLDDHPVGHASLFFVKRLAPH